jgi:hypothetical protein
LQSYPGNAISEWLLAFYRVDLRDLFNRRYGVFRVTFAKIFVDKHWPNMGRLHET